MTSSNSSAQESNAEISPPSPSLKDFPSLSEIPLKTIPIDSDIVSPDANDMHAPNSSPRRSSSVPSISVMVASDRANQSLSLSPAPGTTGRKSPLSQSGSVSAHQILSSGANTISSSSPQSNAAILPPHSNSLILFSAPISSLSKHGKLFVLFYLLGLCSEVYTYVVFFSALSQFVRSVYWFSLARTGFSPATAFFLAFFVPCLITMCQPLRKYFWAKFPFVHIALASLSYLFLFLSMIENVHVRTAVCMVSVVLGLIWTDFRLSSSQSAIRYRSMFAFLLSLPVTQALQFADSSLMPFWAKWHWLLMLIVLGVVSVFIQVVEFFVIFFKPDHLAYVNSAVPDGRTSRFLLSPNYEVEDIHRNKRKRKSFINLVLSCIAVLFWALSFATVFGLTYRFMFGTAVLTSWTGSSFGQGIFIIFAFLLGILISFVRLTQTPAFLFLIAMPLLIAFKLIPQGDVSFVISVFFTAAWPSVLRFFLEEIQFTPSGFWSGHIGLSIAFYVFVAFSEMGTINSGFYLPLFGHIFFEREWLLMILEVLFISLIMIVVVANRIHYFTRLYGAVPPLMQRFVYVFVVPHWVPRETDLVSTTSDDSTSMPPRLRFSFRKFAWRLLEVEHVASWVVAGLSVVAILFVLPSLVLFLVHSHVVPVGEQSSIRVSTYNVYQGFTLHGLTNAYSVADIIEKNHVSVAGFQEIITTRPSNAYFSLIQVLASRTDMIPFIGSVRDTTLGCGFISNRDYLFTDVETLPTNSANSLRRALCEAQFHFGLNASSTLPVYTVHLELGDGGDTALIQINRILERTQNQDTVILMGDFNLEPSTPEIQLLRDSGFYNTFEFLGLGNPVTFRNIDNGESHIDYIFFRGNIKPTHAFVIDSDVSDHFPLIADFVVSEVGYFNNGSSSGV